MWLDNVYMIDYHHNFIVLMRKGACGYFRTCPNSVRQIYVFNNKKEGVSGQLLHFSAC